MQTWGFCCFLLVAQMAAQHYMEEEKLYFPIWKSVKCQKGPLGRSVSSNFIADGSFKICFSAKFPEANG